ncbi:DUF680 domain-containing protein [Mesorhizobium sp. INR15]|uniref:DUF680 domain-containing protein n=1 Tax=Mesorhizobium sp. INR15 TaxID=2654248 RepID=UPI0018969202|nr:DUF680 domain-containing protein [Mesorhizobium sp. INR15]QPC93843.1 DUF680 domain-containing protein [Mesorhizobium sp. INR15]
MIRTVFLAAAILATTGSVFAGSDHYGADGANQPVAAVDHTLTASIRHPDMHQNGNMDQVKTPSGMAGAQQQTWPESGQGIWGN